jgi:lipoic acid synthetase
VLIPDFLGSTEALKAVVESSPEVINHNVETVPRLYPEVRPEANYIRSLQLISRVKTQAGIVTKSGLMLGLGETRDEVIRVMQDLRETSCDLVTIGQYLQPSPTHHPVSRFVPPEEFARYEQIGQEMGFTAVVSAPQVRSSFKAAELYTRVKEYSRDKRLVTG